MAPGTQAAERLKRHTGSVNERSSCQVCLVGRRGPTPPGCRASVGCDVIYSERRGQSQKPEEIYHLIEELVPNGARSASR